MTKRNRDDEEDDEDELRSPFDFFKLLQDPEKLFNNKQFRNLFNNIFEKVKDNLPGEFQGINLEDLDEDFWKKNMKFMKGPFMAGFNVNFSPNGKPHVSSFGNIRTKPDKPNEASVEEQREPLVEVAEEENNIIVIAEMPGVTKQEIELKATSRSLTIQTKNNEFGRNYYKEIDLPAAINSEYAKARYQNGILEVKLKKSDEELKDIAIE